MNGAGPVFLVDADVFGLELAEVDAGDGLAVDDEEEAVSGEQVGKDSAGFGTFDDGVDGVDDGLEAAETLDALDDGGDGGVEDGGAAGDAVGDPGEDAGGGLADEDHHGGRSQNEREQKGEEGARGAAA